MALASLTYHAPLARRAAPPVLDYGLYEQAVAHAERGESREALQKTLQHLFPEREIADLSQPFEFSQGSARVTVSVRGEQVHIAVPFVELPTGGRAIAALRFVLSRISCSGQLHQPVLRGEQLSIEYTDALARIHPAKIVEVLHNLPREADSYDDLLVAEFGAKMLDRAPIAELVPEERARAERIWSEHWDEVDELTTECRRKRSVFFLNELSAFATNRLYFALPLIGIVATRLNEASHTFNNGNGDPNEREAALAKCLRDMRAVTPEVLHGSLGFASYGVSPLRRGTPQLLHRYFGAGSDYMNTLNEYRQGNRAMDTAVGLTTAYSYLLCRYGWADELVQEMQGALEAASGKPWRDYANGLYEHARMVGVQYGKEKGTEVER